MDALANVSRTQANPGPVERIPPELREAAGARLVDRASPDLATAGRRLVEAAPTLGIDLSLMWGTLDRDPSGAPIGVRQVCLAVPGAGRTAMLFVSGNGTNAPDLERAERAASIRHACEHLRREMGDRVVLVQALPEPEETWAIDACRDAGLIFVGDLAYLRRRIRRSEPETPLPPGFSLEPIGAITPAVHARLASVLTATYQGTLDCPELCGLRPVEDVIESHRSAGRWRPGLWWFVLRQGTPVGCMLANPTDDGSAELVYIGLAPSARGQGVGRPALAHLCRTLATIGIGELTCAVDRRNVPAMKLYRATGFRPFASRVAFVGSLA